MVHGQKGHYRRGSDIDLAFFSESEKDLSSNLSWELDDLPSPYLFDLVNYNTLNESPLKEEIDKYGKGFYNKITETSQSYSKKKSLHKQKLFLKQDSFPQQKVLSEQKLFLQKQKSSNTGTSKIKPSFAFKTNRDWKDTGKLVGLSYIRNWRCDYWYYSKD